nr:MAG TPA: hypothetical protein [Caudoviricetes sp.]
MRVCEIFNKAPPYNTRSIKKLHIKELGRSCDTRTHTKNPRARSKIWENSTRPKFDKQ